MFTKHPVTRAVGGTKSIMAQKRRITIKDIAEMAGTSKTTVSFYLNGKTERMSEDTQKRIKKAIEKTGYEPNPLARGMMLCCSSNYSADGERAYIDRLLALGVDGFIVQPTSQFKTVADDIEAAGKKLVFFDSKYYDYTSSWVKTDNYESTYRTVKSCVERGYRRFLLVAAAPQLLSSRIERFSGFVDALEKEGTGFTQFEIAPGEIDSGALRQFLRANIDGETPTLVFAPNCWALPEIYVAMREFYPLMPDKVGLVGFDNFDWTSVASPSVTAIEQPAFEEGREAARILLELLESDEKKTVHQELDCNVQWRSTTL